MKLLTFFHHYELAISFCLLFNKHLGMKVCFADCHDFMNHVGLEYDNSKHAQFLPPIERLEPVVQEALLPLDIRPIMGFEEFMDTAFDFVLVSRIELLPLTEAIRRLRPEIRFLCYSGNLGCSYPEYYEYIGVDVDTYHRHQGRRNLFLLETLPCFYEYNELNSEYVSTVRSFINFMSQYPTWNDLLRFENKINQHGIKLYIHGHKGRDKGFGFFNESRACQNMVAGLHLKFNDGYGYVLQHIALSGRAILTNPTYYMGKALWPIVQTWGIDTVDGNAKQFLKQIDALRDPERIYRQHLWCKEFFNPERAAEIVRKFLE